MWVALHLCANISDSWILERLSRLVSEKILLTSVFYHNAGTVSYDATSPYLCILALAWAQMTVSIVILSRLAVSGGSCVIPNVFHK